ncbi:acetyl esterase (deacetylase) [Desulfitobacterium dehalogenans ATCC 51507]|uniref:Acetyl esterase (Deacetylase) n=1 Tax=Desulfitobacterium dehalogenans (strain ATCC 51507 / DSM 9161 / JW/IU-DC1) TaxID=756499 RepID=I4A484_DESDJ|nr:acetylxylan esterase [Desulfitobacterium dehalogenans]AFL98768.1 acetyl esterase (deacetylase) [Desulfitobacterium dehalogenans ATCC 51507]
MTIIQEAIETLETIPYLGMRPQDFEEFWLEGLRGDTRVKARLELEEIPYPLSKVEVFTATVQSGDQVELKGYFLRPRAINLCETLPGLVRFHGYSGNRGQISELLFWALQGYAVLALDVRGQCGKTPDSRVYPAGAYAGWMTLGLESPHTHYLRQVYLDGVRAVEALANQPEVDEKRIGCIGKSQGGGLAVIAGGVINALGQEVNLKGGVKAVSAAIPFLADFRRSYQLQSGGPMEELSWYFQLHDPEHKREEKVFTTLDYFDGVHFAPWLGKETACLVSMGLKDTVCPPSTVYSLYKAICGEKKLLVYPEYGHESPDGFMDQQIEFFAKELL